MDTNIITNTNTNTMTIQAGAGEGITVAAILVVGITAVEILAVVLAVGIMGSFEHIRR